MLFEQDHVFLLLKIMLSTGMTLLMMASITTFKYSKGRVLLCFGCYLAYVLASSTFLVLHFPWMVFLRAFVFTITIPAVFLIYLLAKDSVTQAIFNYATQVDLFILLAVTATLLNTALNGNQVTDLLLRFVLFGSAALAEYKFLRQPFCRLTDSLRSNWLPMALIPVAFCALLLLCGLFPKHFLNSIWSILQIYMIFVVMGIVYFVIFSSLLKSYRLLENQLVTDVMNAQLYAPQQYLEVLLENRTAVRAIRRGAAQADELLARGDVDGGRAALRDLLPGLSELDRKPLCPIPKLNEVLSYYAIQFEEHHIPFRIELGMMELDMPVAEVCLILNNALRNALEASLLLPEPERSVRLQTAYRQEQFLMRFSNHFDGKLTMRHGLPKSSKPGQGHGYGLTSIRAAAVGARGDIVIHVQDHTTFILDARVRAVPKRREPTKES